MEAQPSRGALARGSIIITNVNVIPMTSDTVIRNAGVIVRDGRIERILPDMSIVTGTRATMIDGRGKYLIPGLADAHTHLYSDDEVADSLASYELGVMLANGVTAARLMIGTPEHLKLRDEVADSKLARLAGATARAGIWSTPTLTVFNTAFAIGFTDDDLRARPDWTLMPANFRRLYLRARERYWAPANDSVRTPERRRRYVEFRNRVVKAIADSGGAGKILAGSDSPDWFMVYGWTMHRELESLVAAGLTPYQALSAATRNPAEYFGASREWGTIEAGKRADLVLLDANPIDDIRNTTRIDGVVIGGRWLPRAELDRMVRAASERVNER